MNVPTGCPTCGGYGNRHDPIAHGTENDEPCMCGTQVTCTADHYEPCCDYRDHAGDSPACGCPMHKQSLLHPFGGIS